MKPYIKLGVIFLAILQIVCGCTSGSLEKETNETTEVNLQHKIVKTSYKGYFQQEIELSTYEPIEGAYLGAYVLANPEIDFDITQFEEAVGKNVAVALRHYKIGDPFPDKWLLECLSKKKAPYIVITPDTMSLPYDRDILEKTAQKFKDTYGIPVFIEFYPGAKEYGDPAKYRSYFQLAKEIFAEYAPNTAFVWSVEMEDIYDSMIYYPGDEYVDWIGISMYFPIYKNNEKYHVDIEEKLSYFYNMYKDTKPMMISKLAISHYSKEDHTFYIEEARDIINQIYSEIPVHYPRIKAINYIDIDNIKVAPQQMGRDNFRVSTESKITNVYKEAINNPYYLEKVEETEKQKGTQWVEMKTPIYIYDDILYILEETILYDWKLNTTNYTQDKIKDCKKIIGGSEYYDLKKVVKTIGYKMNLNKDNIRVYK
ncbi:MAG TPA: hypothetical protein GX707_03145 [Epulopiscium sp.]|nr:hypothetical protein [Candidatus Epulonipiscium sp.]